MTAPSTPSIIVHSTGTILRVGWAPVEDATDYTLYVSTTPFADVLDDPAGLTGEADTELLTSVAHGLTAGDCIVLADLAGGTGLSEGVRYFVIADNLTADDFQISDEKGGSAAAFSADVTDGTWTFALPPASLAVASIADDEVGADGRFQYTFSPEDADVYLVLTALNVDDEESDATTTVYRFGMSGGGRSYGKAAPPKDARNTSDPFGAL